MSNPPRQAGNPEVPLNAPQAPPQAPAGIPPQTPNPAQPGRPQPSPGGGQPRQQTQTQRQPVAQTGIPARPTGPQGRVPAARQRQPIDLATRLDGQRGWLAQLERSLKRRSIIALVLTCLAVGVGAAALYISLTKNADSDRIDALQTRIDTLEAAAGIPPADSATPEGDEFLPETGATLPDDGMTLPDGTTGDPGVDEPDLVIPPATGD